VPDTDLSGAPPQHLQSVRGETTMNMQEAHNSAKTAAPVLEVRELVKTFDRGNVVAVDRVSFTLDQGEVLAILGPSGCGKTTLMRQIAGLDYPDSGDMLVNGQSVLGLAAHKRNIGMVFQDLAVFPHKTIFQNVAFGLRMQKLKKADITRRVHRTLQMVELPPEEWADRYPGTLSGGQKQRVAVARTLAMRPAIVLLDEPMAALDRKLRDRMTVELRQILKRLQTPVLYVTHDQESASFFADRIILMESGRIIQSGSPMDIYRHPQSQFVADFIGTMNFIPARVVEVQSSNVTVEAMEEKLLLGPARAAVGDDVVLGVRPEELRLRGERGEQALFKGKLLTWNFYGGTFHYRVLLKNGAELLVSQPSEEFTDFIDAEIWLESDPAAIKILKE
jgi:ABC-type Fe3+/spermidine/putrescine transport system ATPase subunit